MTERTILLVDDHAMLRKGIRALIENEKGLLVTGEAGDGKQAIELALQLKPDIVIMDINMPNLNGIEATKKILAAAPDTRVLVLSVHHGKKYVEEMLEAGVAGYLLKESAPEELIQAIKAVSEDKGYLSADITNIVLNRLRQRKQPNSAADSPDAQLLENKQKKPELPAGMVYRPALIQRLELGHAKKLTMVIAPSGYGKSTLVADWLERHDHSNVWLSLHNDDNDLRWFLKCLVAVLNNHFPGACRHLQDMIRGAHLPPISILSGAMWADFEKIEHPFVLVLDNMNLIRKKALHDFLSQILMQPLSPMRLVLISRMQPFLPLSSLRLNNEVEEIRIHDLNFSLAEITSFLEQLFRKNIDRKTAETWLQRTDGWVAGLHLASHAKSIPGNEVNEQSPAYDVNNYLLLTNREYEILLLLRKRLRDKEISERLSISQETVKSHLKNIYSKLHASDRRDAIVKALKLGIITAS